ncbi:MAG: DUF4301 family protein [Alphaproteobacteria bacterium]|nr:DUF4301 family protein [Alphaproteobacteria bacterium]
MNFSQQDINQIEQHGLNIKYINKQIENFKSGFPFVNIIRPAAVNDGIYEYSDSEITKYITEYENYAKTHRIMKFVPASGAATRMFKDLFDFLSTQQPNKTSTLTVSNIERFAFWDDLKRFLPQNASDTDIIKCILTDSGLNYGNQPKALIKFHKYSNCSKTPIEEHLTEGTQYASSEKNVNLHFTISPEHKNGFIKLLNNVVPEYEKRYGLKYNISMSEQKSSTDTIAVNLDNTPFRNPDGSLLFRPSGHGALIENLNDIDSDLIFIKNIDNVTTDSLRSDTVKYKKLLAGVLVNIQKQIFKILNDIDSGSADINEIHEFITTKLSVKLNRKLTLNEYKEILNRPLRVCGVVKNTGEPGGGPFWVQDENHNQSLQIVESSQIAPESKSIMQQSSFFNPVDLVCGVYDYKHNKFDLTKYTDPNTGFISEKSKNGIPLRAMEKPGLWNGAMAKWNTILIAVPGTTFSPVKVVTDLLKTQHQ